MINAKIICDSITKQGNRLTTMEIVFPRYILAELNTHRMLSKNSASSRAIPLNKMIKSIQDNPFIPYAWQKDHKGMQGNEYFTDNVDIKANIFNWLEARDRAVATASWMHEGKVTKQLVNRLLEPFMYHKVLISATEFENFFNLRCPQYGGKTKQNIETYFKSRKEALLYIKNIGADIGNLDYNNILSWLEINKGQADIHMMFLAEAMYDAMNESIPNELKEGEWHIPYGDNFDEQALERLWLYDNNQENTIKVEAIEELKQKISIARCARLSYQTLGDNPVIDYEKDLALYEILSTSGHWSPFEHVAKAMTESEYNDYTRTKTEYDYEENYYKGKKVEKGWCRNFQGFIQYRELLD